MQKSEYDRMDRLETSMWWYRGLHRLLVQAIGRALSQRNGQPADQPTDRATDRAIDQANGPSGPRGAEVGVQMGPQAGAQVCRGLDAGCGTGGLLRALSQMPQGVAWFGVELDPQAAARARAKSGRAVAAGSVEALPHGAGTFDVVVCADVLSHALVDPQRALAELYRVLKPEGLLVLNLPAYPWLLSRHDRAVHNARRFTAGQVRAALARQGFAVRASSYWNTLLFPLMLTRRLLAARDNAKSDVVAYPRPLDAAFAAALGLERVWLRSGIGLPFGGSLLVVAQKK